MEVSACSECFLLNLLHEKDMLDANFIWNPNGNNAGELCQMDSDGDGLTNGYELGDDHCHWHLNANGVGVGSIVAARSHPGKLDQ